MTYYVIRVKTLSQENLVETASLSNILLDRSFAVGWFFTLLILNFYPRRSFDWISEDKLIVFRVSEIQDGLAKLWAMGFRFCDAKFIPTKENYHEKIQAKGQCLVKLVTFLAKSLAYCCSLFETFLTLRMLSFIDMSYLHTFFYSYE